MNFLLGGRLGDLIHVLWVAKNTPGKHDFYITDRRDLHSDGFQLSLPETVDELLPILSLQTWFNSLSIYDNQVEFGENQTGDNVNLSMWRRYVYSAPWTRLLSNTFGPAPNGEPWINVPRIPGWQDDIVVHCSAHTFRRGDHWNIIMENYSGHVFVGNEAEYDLFGFKIPFHKPATLFEHFKIINSCKFFVGNQSAPLAMAHALGKGRLGMLNEGDKAAYIGEEEWHKNFYWMAKENHNYEGLAYL